MKSFSILFLLCLCVQLHAYEQWIVVTTIQYPTPALEKLAALPDWHMVVVADKKTPCDWHLDNCEFLSVEDQQKLPYEIVQHLPWNHYSRKNIGYLYAIEHGARVIYETDDDNIIMGDSITYLPVHAPTMHCCTKSHAINPYEYFGQSSVWPRGYPLSHITKKIPVEYEEQTSCVPIQQGVVNSDPDVDAIFRLTHGAETTFEEKPALSLPRNTLCPFNSQNTLFHQEAFWGLLLPITTSFRVCDIWRSYWVQRLLWDMHASLCFTSPTAVQYRNAHNLLKDFADEIDMYLNTERLIAALISWHSKQPYMPDRIRELMQTLIDQKFFKPQEQLLVNAWIGDLQRLGYQFPAVQ